MSEISHLSATAVPFIKANVDTDQLLPKQFLTGITKTGYGKHLFHDWRYLDLKGEQKNPDFVLNLPQFKDAKILIAGENFGCGSSREHAPWAIADFGIKVILAESYADIFYSNCINNLILPIVLSAGAIKYAADFVTRHPSAEIDVDLELQIVLVGERTEEFSIEKHHKTNLQSGLDSIAQSLMLQKKIASHEAALPNWLK
jgi:3-isopropylmalate/(R)-2-methylmalate dehydratase small subunit